MRLYEKFLIQSTNTSPSSPLHSVMYSAEPSKESAFNDARMFVDDELVLFPADFHASPVSLFSAQIVISGAKTFPSEGDSFDTLINTPSSRY